MFDINHLQQIVLRGARPESFHSNWTMVMSELKKPPDPYIIQPLYYKQVQHFQPPVADMSYYQRANG